MQYYEFVLFHGVSMQHVHYIYMYVCMYVCVYDFMPSELCSCIAVFKGTTRIVMCVCALPFRVVWVTISGLFYSILLDWPFVRTKWLPQRELGRGHHAERWFFGWAVFHIRCVKIFQTSAPDDRKASSAKVMFVCKRQCSLVWWQTYANSRRFEYCQRILI